MNLDQELWFKAHVVRATKKSTDAALALERMKGIGPKSARRLFTALAVPAMGYTSPVWSSKVMRKGAAALKVAQRIGAQGIIGAFRTVSLARAEAEASANPLEEGLQR